MNTNLHDQTGFGHEIEKLALDRRPLHQVNRTLYYIWIELHIFLYIFLFFTIPSAQNFGLLEHIPVFVAVQWPRPLVCNPNIIAVIADIVYDFPHFAWPVDFRQFHLPPKCIKISTFPRTVFTNDNILFNRNHSFIFDYFCLIFINSNITCTWKPVLWKTATTLCSLLLLSRNAIPKVLLNALQLIKRRCTIFPKSYITSVYNSAVYYPWDVNCINAKVKLLLLSIPSYWPTEPVSIDLAIRCRFVIEYYKN